MKIKGILDEDFVNYGKCSMYIAFPTCTFKCDRENGCHMCQNMELTHSPDIEVDAGELARRYVDNPLTHAVVMCGLEPLDSFGDVIEFIDALRNGCGCDDDVVIYTGYNKDEIGEYISRLSGYRNIVMKYGRFRPNQEPHFDKVLGVKLISTNQYAERIS